MKKRSTLTVCAVTVVCCLAMALVDGVLRPEYAVKSAIKAALFLLIPLIFILPMFLQNQTFAVFLAEPISDVIAAAVTTGVFLIRFPKILKQGPKQHMGQ